MAKSKTRKSYRRTHHKVAREMTMEQKIGLYLILVTAVMVLFAVFINAFFSSSKIVENRLQALAQAYYETYYYNNLTANGDTGVLTEYSESGLPYVNLTQLLAFNNHQYADYEGYFVNDRYTCNLSNTAVKYYPVEPYGVKDYTVKYSYDCSHMEK